MNLIWIAFIIVALIASGGAFVAAAVGIFYLTRRLHWTLRGLLMCSPILIICLFWSFWLGPTELKDPHKIAERFEKSFGLSPPPSMLGIGYESYDGSDDMAELFCFQTDFESLERLLQLTPSTEAHFPLGNDPSWWLKKSSLTISFHQTQQGAGHFGSSPTKVAYDRSSNQAYIYAYSLR